MSGKEAGISHRDGKALSSKEAAEMIMAQLRELTAGELPDSFTVDDPLLSQGVDSMDLMELRTFIARRFGRPIDASFLFRAGTVARAAALLTGDEEEDTPPGSSDRDVTAGLGAAFAGQSANAASPARHEDAIAIIGVACRFPSADGPEAFWALLDQGRTAIRPPPNDRWPQDDSARTEDGGASPSFGAIDDVAGFDAAFFQISPREAELMDPQQRHLLEMTWHMFEREGIVPGSLLGAPVGVFVGACHYEYRDLLGACGIRQDAYLATGTFPALLANRLSYHYGFTGPSVTTDTACSSSLVALHQAADAMRRGECELAVVAGVNLICDTANTGSFGLAGMLSAKDRCHSFDAGADGYVRGEGAGVVLLQPLAAARKEGRHIYGLLRGTAVAHGGRTSSLTAPEPGSQTAVILAACGRAGIDIGELRYIEAHGTGTPLGDPIEVAGIKGALERRQYPENAASCYIGSVKTNIGHLEGAAGIAGLIKVLLSFEHGYVPPITGFQALNPHIDLADSGIVIADRRVPLQTGEPVVAGISSFGFGGTIAHAIVESWPETKARAPEVQEEPHLFILSARTVGALRKRIADLSQFMDAPAGRGTDLADVAYTLQIGRTDFPVRFALLAQSQEELRAQLRRAHEASDLWDLNEAWFCDRPGRLPPPTISRSDIAEALDRRDADTIASAWIAGADIPWAKLYDDAPARPIHLPVYPFEHLRFWPELSPRPETAEPSQDKEPIAATLRARVAAALTSLAATQLKLAEDEIFSDAPLAEFGFDSIGFGALARAIERRYDIRFPTSLFYRHGTISALTTYLIDKHAGPCADLHGAAEAKPKPKESSGAGREVSTPDTDADALSAEPWRSPIAITGMSARLPGCENVDAFWQTLAEGRCAIEEVPADRFDWRDVWGDPQEKEGFAGCKWMGALDDVYAFDSEFFDISRREALRMDPRQRLILEEIWHAMENAALGAAQIERKVGVFVGLEHGDHADASGNGWTLTENHDAVLASRLSYFLDLRGPAMSVNTACSSGLLAAHLACQSLWLGEADIAVAASTNLLLTDGLFVAMGQAGMLSPTGRCRAFSVYADGMVPSDGVVAVVLKPLAMAEADNDDIKGVIIASGVNYDGRTNGLTAPSSQRQAELVVDVYRRFEIEPKSIGYAVCHGTATRLGDPAEIHALSEAYATFTDEKAFCKISSNKPNIGHTLAAAGLVNLVNVTEALRRASIPQSLFCETPTDEVDWPDTPFIPAHTTEDWPSDGGERRRGSVSAFGMTGTNTHMIVEEYVDTAAAAHPTDPQGPLPVLISTKRSEDFPAIAKDLAEHLAHAVKGGLFLSDLAFTLACGRIHLPHRLAFLADSLEQTIDILTILASGDRPSFCHIGEVRKQESQLSRTPSSSEAVEACATGKWSEIAAQAIAEGFCLGEKMDLPRAFGTLGAKRRPLPGYPFRRVTVSREKKQGDRSDLSVRQKSVTSDLAIPVEEDPIVRLLDAHLLHDATGETQSASGLIRLTELKDGRDPDAARQVILERSDGDVLRLSVNTSGQAAIDAKSLVDALCDISADARKRGKALIRGDIPSSLTLSGMSDLTESALIKAYRRLAEEGPPIVLAFEEHDGSRTDCAALLAGLADIAVMPIPLIDSAPHIAAAGPRQFLRWRFAIQDFGEEGAATYREAGLRPTDQSSAKDTAEQIGQALLDIPADSITLLRRHLVESHRDGLSRIDRPDFAHVIAPKPMDRGEAEFSSTNSRVTRLEGNIALIEMTDIAGRNMFQRRFVDDLRAAFQYVSHDPSFKVAILTGYEGFFSAGGDKDSLLAIQKGDLKFTDYQIYSLALEAEIPVIAALSGHAVGAGWSLAAYCDHLVYAEDGVYYSPYITFGFTPGAGATLSLRARYGLDLAREILISGMHYRGRDLASRNCRDTVVPRQAVLCTAFSMACELACAPRAELIAAKRPRRDAMLSVLADVYSRELAMHEQSFLRNDAVKSRIERYFAEQGEQTGGAESEAAPGEPETRMQNQVVEKELIALLADELLLEVSEVDPLIPFSELGLDSVIGVSWVRRIGKELGVKVQATRLYEFPNLRALAQHIAAETTDISAPATSVGRGNDHKQRSEAAGQRSPAVPWQGAKMATAVATAPQKVLTENNSAPQRTTVDAWAIADTQSIAIVGIAGRFPGASDLQEFWQNIAAGRFCVEEVPAGRWPIDEYFSEDRRENGKTYGRWMGVVPDADAFDPLFFNISPREAAYMDPQQRLFLENCWHAIEDAGYDPSTLAGERCGVFAGCAVNDYGQTQLSDANIHGITGSESSVLAGRVAYHLDLRGPCIAIDTACSSSLVAIVEAAESLANGRCDSALAGGVCVMPGPRMHLLTSKAGMLSSQGRCAAFGEGADGFVPAEGVGVLFLKRTSDALADGDDVYASISGWGTNQDGKTNGITAPNLLAQNKLQTDVYERFDIDPSNIQLVECHGTGTRLGDPIEVEALQRSFSSVAGHGKKCALGSVKSNIGHALAAAGVASVLKVVMALRHRQIPPTIHCDRINDHIDLGDGPFYVERELVPWQVGTDGARRAAISSFGFSGSNAHIVLEGVPEKQTERLASGGGGKILVPLSGKTPEACREAADRLLRHLQVAPDTMDLQPVAFTLQTGRSQFPCRVAVTASSVRELSRRLECYLAGHSVNDDGIFVGDEGHRTDALAAMLSGDDTARGLISRWAAAEEWDKVAALWTKGVDVDWSHLWPAHQPRRAHLPGYAFARERYWLPLESMSLSGRYPGEERRSGGPVAIIGVSCMLPRADTLGEFWRQLEAGADLMEEIPAERWDWRAFDGDPRKDRNKTNVHSASFIDRYASFDPLFFGISPKEAGYMDPQQRVSMEVVWNAIEDAGYAPASLKGGDLAIYIGTRTTEYSQLLKQADIALQGYSGLSSSSSVGANRLSNLFDVHGASEAVDTACSSSLVAIDKAVNDLHAGRSRIAVAGGVNLIISPDLHISFSKAGMLSADGRSKTFSAHADGYGRGEGAAMVVLKPLDAAERDGDHIYAVILGTAVNHAGGSGGLTAPNEDSQVEVVERALSNAGVRPDEISCIETHGTGTPLGDRVEVAALTRVFATGTRNAPLAIGSVKTNIGSLEFAAGIASVLKLVLQMRNRRLAPSIHAEPLNPALGLPHRDIAVVTRPGPWEREDDRALTGGVSSFGFGGVNAHLVLREYREPDADRRPSLSGPLAFVLSAKTDEALTRRASDLAAYLRQEEGVVLEDVAYTLQTGRQHFDRRVAVVAANRQEVLAGLDRCACEGRASAFGEDGTGHNVAGRENDQGALAIRWLGGEEIDWSRLYEGTRVKRTPLPGYPFADERYWLPASAQAPVTPPSSSKPGPGARAVAAAWGYELSGSVPGFGYDLDTEAFYFSEHLVQKEKVLPGVAHLELARHAAQSRLGKSGEDEAGWRLSSVLFVRPLKSVADRTRICVRFTSVEDDAVTKYEIRDGSDGCDGKLYSRGRVERLSSVHPDRLDLDELKARFSGDGLNGEAVYRMFRQFGIDHGPCLRGIKTLRKGDGSAADKEVFAEIVLPAEARPEAGNYPLHPGVMDSVLQVCIVMPSTMAGGTTKVPFSIEQMDMFAPTPKHGFVWLRTAGPETASGQRYDIDLCDDQGIICVRFRGFMFRSYGGGKEEKSSLGERAKEEERDRAAPAGDAVPAGDLALAPVWRPLLADATLRGSDLPKPVYFRVGRQRSGRPGEEHDEWLGGDETIDDLAYRLAASGRPKRIVLSYPDAASPALDDPDTARRASGATIFCFRFLKALQKVYSSAEALELRVVTRQASRVRSLDGVNPLQAGIYGLVGSASKELPHWHLLTIDLPPDTERQPERNALMMTPKVPKGQTIAFRDGQWFAQYAAETAFGDSLRRPYHREGVYIVIGGAGGLGAVWSEHVARQYGAQICWVGRRPNDREITSKISTIGRVGPSPLYFQADAGDPAALAAIRDDVMARFGRIDGVVHAALVLRDRSIANMDEDRFAEALAAKVDTSLAMVEAFSDPSLDFMVFFSSALSFSRLPGQSNYGAGCTFKDALAEQLRGSAPFAVKTVNWGWWGEDGAVASEDYRSRMDRIGVGSTDAAAAMAILDRLMASEDVDQLIFYNSTKPLQRGEVGVIGLPIIEGIRADLARPSDLPWLEPTLLERSCATLKAPSRYQDSPDGKRMEALCLRWLRGLLRDAGAGSDDTLAQSEIVPAHHDWAAASLDMLRRGQALRGTEGTEAPSAIPFVREWEDFRASISGDSRIAPLAAALDAVMGVAEQTLRGARPVTTALFPNGSMELLENVYAGNPVVDHFNDAVARLVDTLSEHTECQDGIGHLRILEVGAGTGGTSRKVLEKLKETGNSPKEYCYTDLSQAFLSHARKKFSEDHQFLTLRRLDVTRPVEAQEFGLCEYDMVIATNVLHATPDMAGAVRHIKQLLRPGGWLIINELSERDLFRHIVFGLLPEWWAHSDADRRIPGCPAASPAAWQRLLRDEGYKDVCWPLVRSHPLGQQIITARSSGPITGAAKRKSEGGPAQEEAVGEPERPMAGERHEAPMPETRAVDAIEEAVIATLSRSLKIPRERLEKDIPFADYGVDSITGIELVQDIGEAIGRPLDATILFDYPNLAGLIRHLTESESRAATKADLPGAKAGGPIPLQSANPIQTAECSHVSEEAVAAVVARTMQISADRISYDTPFADYGVDSITGIELIENLNSELGLQLHNTALFDHPTIRMLAAISAGAHPQGSGEGARLPHPSTASSSEDQRDVPVRRSDTPGGEAEWAELVTRKVCDVLGVPASRVDRGLPLADYGVDSITGVELVSQISSAHGIQVEMTALFDYPNIAALASYLARTFGPPTKNGDEGPSPVSSAETMSDPIPETKSQAVPAPSEASNERPAEEAVAAFAPVSELPEKDRVAIIGMSGRYPQSEDLESLWEHLVEGEDLISAGVRWSGLSECSGDAGAEDPVQFGGSLSDVECFDAEFFNISGIEAGYSDPQQRLFLQEAWHALEDGGIPDPTSRGMKCGVFVGTIGSDYASLFGEDVPPQAFWGNASSVLASRISYVLDLKGPALAVDTACSSSLVAIHLACQSILRGESDLAIAGGVTVLNTPRHCGLAARAGMLSPRGRCMTFSSSADGFVSSEGVGVVVLKSERAALRDNDRIHAVIVGSALNQDGRSNGITAPNGIAQEELLRGLYEDADIDPSSIDMFEAHGTGTPLGDPIEFSAASRAFRHFTAKEGFCAIGSVKSNLGHSSAAAGVAGVLKAVMAMRKGMIPPTLHADHVNSAIRVEGSPFFIAGTKRPWPQTDDKRRRAAVSAFGFGGTNAHIVLEEGPRERRRASVMGPFFFPLSAATGGQVREAAQALLTAVPETITPLTMKDMSWTLSVGRRHHRKRMVILAENGDDLKAKLRAVTQGRMNDPALFESAADKAEGPASAVASRLVKESLAALVAGEGADGGDLWEHARVLAELYVGGQDVDWREAFAGSEARAVSLPGYPFARTRYWWDDGRKPKASENEVIELYTEQWQESRRSMGGSRTFGHTLCLISSGVDATPFAQKIKAIDPSAEIGFHDLQNVRLAHAPETASTRSAAVDALIAQLEAEMTGVETVFCCLGDLCGDPIEEAATASAVFAAAQRWGIGRLIFMAAAASPGARALRDALCALSISARASKAETEVQCLIGEGSFAGSLPQLFAAAGDQQGEDVLVDGGAVFRRQLVRVDQTSPAPALERGGVYVLTGALGGAGRALCSWLAAEYDAKLILIGRSSSPMVQDTLGAISRMGESVAYFEADVTDGSALRRIADRAYREHGRIDGIFHLAGTFTDHAAATIGGQDIIDVLEPKITGTDEIISAFAPLEPRFVCLFSSAAAVMGDAGAGAYALANRYQLSLAQRGRPGVQIKAIAWPALAHGGMVDVTAPDIRAVLERTKQHSLGEKDVARVIALVLSPSSPATVMAIKPISAGPLVETQLAEKNPDHVVVDVGGEPEAAKDVERAMAEEAAIILRIPESRLTGAGTFSSFGFDSITLSQFAGRLSRRFGTSLSPAIFLDHPTLEKCAAHISRVAAMSEKKSQDDGSYSAERSGEAEPQDPSIGGQAGRQADDVDPHPVGKRPVTEGGEKTDDLVALIGYSGRFPGARTVEEFWTGLLRGEDKTRWVYPRSGDHPSGEKKALGEMPGIWEFEPEFFEISPRQARQLDPRERLLLQEGWRALEDAGIDPSTLGEKSAGVFVGLEAGDFAKRTDVLNGSNAISSAKLAYFLDLKGPVLSIDTACSSGLVAFHQAVRALKDRECDVALVGSANAVFEAGSFETMKRAGIISPEGSCKVFASSADGIVPAEAAVAVVVKRLGDAIDDGDDIRAVIRASAINYDGRTDGISAPSTSAQARLVRSAVEIAGLTANDIGYAVLHGTGTELGDAVELGALSDAYGDRDGSEKCVITSNKANIGHCFAAAGLVNLIHAAEALRHEIIPPSINSQPANDLVDWVRAPIAVSDRASPWPYRPDRKRCAAVSAFGLSGTNAHVIVSDHVRAAAKEMRGPFLLPLSAKNSSALRTRAAELAAFFEKSEGTSVLLQRASATLMHGRAHFSERCLVLADDARDAVRQFRQIGSGGATSEDEIIRRMPAFASAVTSFMRGGVPDWGSTGLSEKDLKVGLPTYPFEAKEYRPETKTMDIVKSAPSGGAVRLAKPATLIEGQLAQTEATRGSVPVSFDQTAERTEESASEAVRSASTIVDVLEIELPSGAPERLRHLPTHAQLASQLLAEGMQITAKVARVNLSANMEDGGWSGGSKDGLTGAIDALEIPLVMSIAADDIGSWATFALLAADFPIVGERTVLHLPDLATLSETGRRLLERRSGSAIIEFINSYPNRSVTATQAASAVPGLLLAPAGSVDSLAIRQVKELVSSPRRSLVLLKKHLDRWDGKMNPRDQKANADAKTQASAWMDLVS